MWRFALNIEDKPHILKEYGRAIALITNVEYWLKELIKFKSGKTDEKELGKLIEDSKIYLTQNIYNRLKVLNRKRILIIHGAVISFAKIKGNMGTDRIIKTDKFTKKEKIFPLNATNLKRISESARKLIRTLIDIHLNSIKPTF